LSDLDQPDIFAAGEEPEEGAADVAAQNAAAVAEALALGDAPPPPVGNAEESSVKEEGDELAKYAARAYLEYAIAVVKGRALPDLRDGQKPVQRRILHTMREMGLLGGNAERVKSARVVGSTMGQYHPHGDSSIYDASVRMAQDFSLRYPLIDGQGNFGSRDGDNAAAMRYTEMRLTPIAQLLLSELDQNTVDFKPNYDGKEMEPDTLPARLPFVLLNGASGIAVGMATEIPSHNLREVAAAAALMVEKPDTGEEEILGMIPGPDFPGGGQLIASPNEIANAYRSGRSTLPVRARYTFEERARGQWQVVFTELPPGTSAAKVLGEIEALTNPQPKTGKKAIEPEQAQTKALLLSLIDEMRDESDKNTPVRLVFEPKSSRQDRQSFVNTLLAYTSLEGSVSINLVMVGIDGRPQQKTLHGIISEWASFRVATVDRRLRHRLTQVLDRIHILEGRLVVFLNIDEVIRIIRESDEPKAALIARFNLSDRQAEDILEIRLRQLSRLEGIKIEQEIAGLQKERDELESTLGSDSKLRRLVAKEIRDDAKKFGDDRRTLIESAARASLAEAAVIDEPLTLIISNKGWLRSRQGHGIDRAALNFKEGDGLMAALECRSVDTMILLASDGRSFSLSASQLPGGKGDGVPAASLLEFGPGVRIVGVIAGKPEQTALIASSGGYGFLTTIADMSSRQKAGKAFLTIEAGETPLPPVLAAAKDMIALASADGRLLVIGGAEVKQLPKGRGVILMGVGESTLVHAQPVRPGGVQLPGKRKPVTVSEKDLGGFFGVRAKKGKIYL
jgi:topoisomerase-4 subunit A